MNGGDIVELLFIGIIIGILIVKATYGIRYYLHFKHQSATESVDDKEK